MTVHDPYPTHSVISSSARYGLVASVPALPNTWALSVTRKTEDAVTEVTVTADRVQLLQTWTVTEFGGLTSYVTVPVTNHELNASSKHDVAGNDARTLVTLDPAISTASVVAMTRVMLDVANAPSTIFTNDVTLRSKFGRLRISYEL